MEKLKKKVIIDCDPGADDGLALMLALHCPELDIRAVTVVAGNRNVDVCVKNALKILEHYGRGDIPVYKGTGNPLMKTLPQDDVYSGKDGMAEVFLPYGGAEPANGKAVRKIEELAEEQPGEIHIISIAPMTNIALAILGEPEIKEKIASIITINGCYGVARSGQFRSRTEWNVYVDPDAAKIVLESGIPVYAMGVDVTEQIPQDLYSRLLCSSEKGSMHWHYLEAAGNFLRGRGLNPAGLFVDVMAVAWACDESMAKFAEGKVLVERFGEGSSGRTVFDQSGNINNKSRLFAAYEYDFEKLRKLLIERVFK